MQQINIQDAKDRLSQLLDQACAGEDVVIAKAGKPVVRLVPYAPRKLKIAPPGAMAGEIWIAEDFDAPVETLFDSLRPKAE